MFRKTLLDNGIPLLMERIRGVRSVCLGIWVKVGSRYEARQRNGISHFVEHMLFKGTKRRTQKEIAFEIDSLGGDLNAFTSKETTTFYIKVLDDYIERGLELLMDIFLNSSLPEEEIRKEKAIIIEEIKMVEDTPDDYVHDLFNEHVWGREGLGLSILGTKRTAGSLSREDLIEHIQRYYRADNIVISCTGNIDFQALERTINGYTAGLGGSNHPQGSTGQRFRYGTRVLSKEHAEVHLCMGAEGIPQGSPERYAMLLLNSIVGSGVSSRLFQKVREQRGLAYSVYSFISSYVDTGVFGVYVGTGRRKYRQVIDLVMKELRTLKDTLSEDELSRAKKQLKGNMVLALESTLGRMNNIARQEIYHGRYFSPAEIMREIERVSLSEVRALAERLLCRERFALTILGPVDRTEV